MRVPARERSRTTRLRSGLWPSLRAPRSAALAWVLDRHSLAVEGVSEVFYLRRIARGVDGYDVEADLAEAGEAARGQNLRGCAGDAAALSGVDRLRGAAEALAAAESYLDKAEGVAVERHEV